MIIAAGTSGHAIILIDGRKTAHSALNRQVYIVMNLSIVTFSGQILREPKLVIYVIKYYFIIVNKTKYRGFKQDTKRYQKLHATPGRVL